LPSIGQRGWELRVTGCLQHGPPAPRWSLLTHDLYKNCMRNLIPAVLASVAVWTAAFIPMPAAAQGTPDQRAACEGDAQRLCGHCIPDVDCITFCMIQRERYVSAACRSVMRRGTHSNRARY
jgi:hypothetical protein